MNLKVLILIVLVEEFDYHGLNGIKRVIGVTGHEFDTKRDFYIIKLEKPIIEGNIYLLYIDFVSKLNDGLKGFYRSTYENEKGEKE